MSLNSMHCTFKCFFFFLHHLLKVQSDISGIFGNFSISTIFHNKVCGFGQRSSAQQEFVMKEPPNKCSCRTERFNNTERETDAEGAQRVTLFIISVTQAKLTSITPTDIYGGL